jgi:carboxypeptidase Taq
MAAQLYAAAEADLADQEAGGLSAQIEAGTFEPLLGWLREHVHRHGRTKTASEILDDVTGGGLDAAPWLTYVRQKYGALYGVTLPA